MNQENKSSVKILQNTTSRKKTKIKSRVFIYSISGCVLLFILSSIIYYKFYIRNQISESQNYIYKEEFVTSENQKILESSKIAQKPSHENDPYIQMKDKDFKHIFNHSRKEDKKQNNSSPFEQVLSTQLNKNTQPINLSKNKVTLSPKNEEKLVSKKTKLKNDNEKLTETSPLGSVQILIVTKPKEE